MAERTHIEWTDATWNPITGCTLVSEGCRNCYAAQLAATRLRHHPSRSGLARLNAEGVAKFTGEVRFNPQWLDQPIRWKRPRRIFVCAHGDLFHGGVQREWLVEIFARIALAPQHIYQILTKRPAHQRAILSDPSFVRQVYERVCDLTLERELRVVLIADPAHQGYAPAGTRIHLGVWPLPNVWLGTSVEDQLTADERIPELLATPAALRWISAEPLLGPIDLRQWQHDYGCGCGWGGDSPLDYCRECGWRGFAPGANAPEDCPECGCAIDDYLACPECDGQDGDGLSFGPNSRPRLDWVVAGGESGKNARPMHPDWARSLREQCASAGVPFLFKQWGEWAPQVGAIDGWSIADDPEQSRYDHLEYDIESEAWGTPFRPAWCDWDGLDEAQVVSRIGKRQSGRLLDGVLHDEFPDGYGGEK